MADLSVVESKILDVVRKSRQMQGLDILREVARQCTPDEVRIVRPAFRSLVNRHALEVNRNLEWMVVEQLPLHSCST